jgi:tRNA-Thr(GGU) m(6)t(6)A37 methyltransferase TsaA
MKVHPHHDPNQAEVGVFASRSPKRPNFLGLTRVRLLERNGNILVVKGLDAFDGTPVVDIKPAHRRNRVGKNHK